MTPTRHYPHHHVGFRPLPLPAPAFHRETVKSFDAFTKVEHDMGIQQTSTGGALTTIVAGSLIIFLILSELSYYQQVLTPPLFSPQPANSL